MAAAARLVTAARLDTYLAVRTRWRRAGVVPAWCATPAWTLARPARPVAARLDRGRRVAATARDRELYDLDGTLICIPDLLDEEAGLVGEYDGAEHLTLRRRVKDDAREEACRRVGLEHVRFTGPDVRNPDRVVRRLLAARSRALFLPAGERRWTLEQPDHRWAGRWWAG